MSDARMQRIVINSCYGGFSLSQEAKKRLRELKHPLTLQETEFPISHEIARDDKLLVQVLDELGSKASAGRGTKLEIIEIPDDVKWHIWEYDGWESIHENHRAWPDED